MASHSDLSLCYKNGDYFKASFHANYIYVSLTLWSYNQSQLLHTDTDKKMHDYIKLLWSYQRYLCSFVVLITGNFKIIAILSYWLYLEVEIRI